MTVNKGDEACDEYGVPFSEYPDCEHSDIEPGERCTTCVPPAVRQQRLIDQDPEGYDRAVDAMWEAAERTLDEATWSPER